MTVIEAINKVDALKPNTYLPEQKVGWLSRLDALIKLNIIDTHEGGEDITFTPYDADSDDAVLLVPAPYDDIYLRWLEAQIDYYNNEYAKYNISATAYNNCYEEYANYYNRTHMPLSTNKAFF